METAEKAIPKQKTRGTTSSLFTLNKRSHVMKNALVLFFTLILSVSLTFGQNIVIGSGSSFTNSGTINVKGNITNTGVAGATAIGGTVNLNGSGAQAVGSASNGAINFATLNATTATTKTLNVSSTISTAVDVTNTASIALAGGNTLTLTGTIAQTSGSYVFSNATSVVDYAGGAQTVIGTTYANLTTSAAGTKSMNNDVTVNSALTLTDGNLSIGANELTIAGTISTSSGTLEGSSSSDIAITGTGNATLPTVTNGLGNLTVNRTGGTDVVTLGGNLTVATALALTDGELAVGTTTLTLQGTVGSTSGTLSSATTGTVDYAQSSNGQSVLASNYGNLTFSDFAKVLPSSEVGIAGTFVAGAGVGHTITGNTINFNGASQSLPAFTYNHLFTSGSGTKTASGNLSIAGNFDNGGSGDATITTDMGTNTLAITGTRENTNGTIQFAGASNGLLFTTGTVEYNAGAGTQTIAGHTSDKYATLLLTTGGTKQVATGASNTVHTTGSITVNSGVTLDIVGGGILNVDADLTIDGTITNAGTVTVGN
jgi:hypothetical protein